MGNITQQYIARVAKELMEKHPEEFGLDFNVNKVKVNEFCSVKSKGTRNKMAGYITHKVKPEKKEAETAA